MIEVKDHNTDIRNVVTLTIDLSILRSRAILRDLSYVCLYLCYGDNLSVYFHIIEVKNYKIGILNTNTETLSVDLTIQGYLKGGLTFCDDL